MNFVEICNVRTRKAIIEAAKRISNSDNICRSYCDFYFGVTSFGTQYITSATSSIWSLYTVKPLILKFKATPKAKKPFMQWSLK